MLTVKNIRKTYKQNNEFILSDIHFSMESNEICGLLGANGSGKSTLIKLLAGIMPVDQGAIQLLGFDPYSHRKKIHKQAGFLFGQRSQLDPDLPVRVSFLFWGSIHKIKRNILKNRIDAFSKIIDVEPLLGKPGRELSLGQRVLCDLLLITLHEPQILVLDEPTIGLDVIVKDQIKSILLEYAKKNKASILIASHDFSFLEKFINRMIVLDNGKMIFDHTDFSTAIKYNKKIEIYCRNLHFDKNQFIDENILIKKNNDHIEIFFNSMKTPQNYLIEKLVKTVDTIENLNITDIMIEDLIRNKLWGTALL